MSSFVKNAIAMYFKALLKRLLQGKTGRKPAIMGGKSRGKLNFNVSKIFWTS
jgi:hypothetical protein